METRETNRVNMIRTTCQYCDLKVAITAPIAAFAPALANAKNKLVLIDQLDQIAIGSTTGVTLDTTKIRTTMEDLSFKCGSAVAAYANSINNSTLYKKVNYTRSQYTRFKKDEVDDICQTVHDEANTNIVAAGPFGYVAGDVTALQTAIDLYRTSTQNPRQAIISRSSAISQISALITETITNVFKGLMDKMVNTLKATQPVFVSDYFKAREIINLGSTTGKVRGTTVDANGVALAGVIFIIRKTGTSTIVTQTNSDTKGKFNIANLLPSDYDFTWEFPNYQTVKETNVHLAAGKELTRKVKMLPV